MSDAQLLITAVQAQLEQRRWSQSELARQLGLSQSMISMFLRGQKQPGLRLCQGLADLLGWPLEEVLQWAGRRAGGALDTERTRLVNRAQTLIARLAEHPEGETILQVLLPQLEGLHDRYSL